MLLRRSALNRLALGDRGVVHINEDVRFSTIRLRTEGFRRSLEQHGLPFDPRNNLALVSSAPTLLW